MIEREAKYSSFACLPSRISKQLACHTCHPPKRKLKKILVLYKHYHSLKKSGNSLNLALFLVSSLIPQESNPKRDYLFFFLSLYSYLSSSSLLYLLTSFYIPNSISPTLLLLLYFLYKERFQSLSKVKSSFSSRRRSLAERTQDTDQDKVNRFF